MSDLIWLTPAQMDQISPCFPLSHGVPRVDDQRIVSGIIIVLTDPNQLLIADITPSRSPPASSISPLSLMPDPDASSAMR